MMGCMGRNPPGPPRHRPRNAPPARPPHLPATRPCAQLLEARTPVQKLMLSNKMGKVSQIVQLPVS
jgi:hypothetical protein